MKNVYMKSKIIVTYARENFVMIKIIKVNVKYFAKLEIITTTTPENLEVLPTIFVIEDTTRKEKFQWCFIMALTTIII